MRSRSSSSPLRHAAPAASPQHRVGARGRAEKANRPDSQPWAREILRGQRRAPPRASTWSGRCTSGRRISRRPSEGKTPRRYCRCKYASRNLAIPLSAAKTGSRNSPPARADARDCNACKGAHAQRDGQELQPLNLVVPATLERPHQGIRDDHGSETDARGGDEHRGHARWLTRRVREEGGAGPRPVGPWPCLAQVHGQDLAPPLQGKQQRLMGLRCPAMRLRVQRPASTRRGAPPPRTRGCSAAPEEGAPQAAEEMRRCPGQAPGQLGRCACTANAKSRDI